MSNKEHIEKIKKLTTAVNEKRAELKDKKGALTGKWKTSGKLEAGISLRAITDKVALAQAFQKIMRMNEDFVKSHATLFNSVAELQHIGYTYSEWEDDFKLQAKHIELKEIEVTIKKIEDILENHTPEEVRRDKAISEVEDLLGGL